MGENHIIVELFYNPAVTPVFRIHNISLEGFDAMLELGVVRREYGKGFFARPAEICYIVAVGSDIRRLEEAIRNFKYHYNIEDKIPTSPDLQSMVNDLGLKLQLEAEKGHELLDRMYGTRVSSDY